MDELELSRELFRFFLRSFPVVWVLATNVFNSFFTRLMVRLNRKKELRLIADKVIEKDLEEKEKYIKELVTMNKQKDAAIIKKDSKIKRLELLLHEIGEEHTAKIKGGLKICRE